MLSQAFSPGHLAAGLIAFITVAMFLNMRRYFARRMEAKMRYEKRRTTGDWTPEACEERNPVFLDAREVAQQNAQIPSEKTFTGASHKPEVISKWEIEFFELTREMTAKLDVKMTAMSTLIRDAGHVCQRMEQMIERLDKLVEKNEAGGRASAPLAARERVENFELPKKSGDSTQKIEPPIKAGGGRPEIGRSVSPKLTPTFGAEFQKEHLPKDVESPTKASGLRPPASGLFPRLASIPDLGFSEDIDDLSTIGSGIFDDEPEKTEPKPTSAFKDVDDSDTISTFHSPYFRVGKEKKAPHYSEKTQSPNPQPQVAAPSPIPHSQSPIPNPPSPTLGELLLQNTNGKRAADLQATPHIATAQQTIIQQALEKQNQPPPRGKEAIFMPIPEK